MSQDLTLNRSLQRAPNKMFLFIVGHKINMMCSNRLQFPLYVIVRLCPFFNFQIVTKFKYLSQKSTHKDGPSGACQKFGGTAGFSIDTRNPPAVLLHSRPINSKTLKGL